MHHTFFFFRLGPEHMPKILVFIRCSHFRHQSVSSSVQPKRPPVGNFCLKCRLPRYILGIFYMPQIYDMGRTALLPLRRKACPLKIRRLRPGLNPQTWVPKASMLPLDHRSIIPKYSRHFSWTACPLQMGLAGCPETSVRNYHCTQCKILRP